MSGSFSPRTVPFASLKSSKKMTAAVENPQESAKDVAIQSKVFSAPCSPRFAKINGLRKDRQRAIVFGKWKI